MPAGGWEMAVDVGFNSMLIAIHSRMWSAGIKFETRRGWRLP